MTEPQTQPTASLGDQLLSKIGNLKVSSNVQMSDVVDVIEDLSKIILGLHIDASQPSPEPSSPSPQGPAPTVVTQGAPGVPTGPVPQPQPGQTP